MDRGKIEEAVIVDSNRRLSLDFIECRNGRYLRVSQGAMSSVHMQAIEMMQWRNNLSKMINEYDKMENNGLPSPGKR